LSFGFLYGKANPHHGMERQIEVPTNFNVGPTSLAELVNEEQMKCRFLVVLQTHDTIVVVVLEFMSFPSENVPYI
jgi:hypothetical protein